MKSQKNASKILNAFKNTLRHIILSVILISGYTIFSVFTFKDYSTVKGIYMSDVAIQSIIIVLILFIILLPGIFLAYTFFYSNLSFRSKLIDSLLLYLIFGLSIPLFLLIAGSISYRYGPDVGWLIVIGQTLLLPALILSVGNYLYMLKRIKNGNK